MDNKDKGTNVQVAVRCRPANLEEKKSAQPSVITCDVENRMVKVAYGPVGKKITKNFTFDRVFGMYSRQEEIFNSVVKPIVDETLAGFNCTIFAYGQTGTGKTHTMEGDINSEEDAGIVPRSVKYILNQLESSGIEFTIRVSFLELYNEELQDLLNTSGDKKLKLCEDLKKGVVCQNLEEIAVLNASDILEILQRGIQQRQTAATLCNKNSSRSHSIFTMKIMIKEYNVEGEEVVRHGQLNLVDLAGSECIGRSGAKNDRAREAGSINQSLLTLGRVITALVDHHPHIPYRDSKLTRLLQESLGGKAKTCIIATLSPSQSAVEETMSTLDYAHRAKNIKNQPILNQKLTKKIIMKEYFMEIEQLKLQLQMTREKNGIYLDPEVFYNMENKIANQENQLLECESYINQYTNDIKELKASNTTLTNNINKLTNENTILNNTNNSLLNDISKLKSKYSDILNELEVNNNIIQLNMKKNLIENNNKKYLINNNNVLLKKYNNIKLYNNNSMSIIDNFFTTIKKLNDNLLTNINELNSSNMLSSNNIIEQFNSLIELKKNNYLEMKSNINNNFQDIFSYINDLNLANNIEKNELNLKLTNLLNEVNKQNNQFLCENDDFFSSFYNQLKLFDSNFNKEKEKLSTIQSFLTSYSQQFENEKKIFDQLLTKNSQELELSINNFMKTNNEINKNYLLQQEQSFLNEKKELDNMSKELESFISNFNSKIQKFYTKNSTNMTSNLTNFLSNQENLLDKFGKDTINHNINSNKKLLNTFNSLSNYHKDYSSNTTENIKDFDQLINNSLKSSSNYQEFTLNKQQNLKKSYENWKNEILKPNTDSFNNLIENNFNIKINKNSDFNTLLEKNSNEFIIKCDQNENDTESFISKINELINNQQKNLSKELDNNLNYVKNDYNDLISSSSSSLNDSKGTYNSNNIDKTPEKVANTTSPLKSHGFYRQLYKNSTNFVPFNDFEAAETHFENYLNKMDSEKYEESEFENINCNELFSDSNPTNTLTISTIGSGSPLNIMTNFSSPVSTKFSSALNSLDEDVQPLKRFNSLDFSDETGNPTTTYSSNNIFLSPSNSNLSRTLPSTPINSPKTINKTRTPLASLKRSSSFRNLLNSNTDDYDNSMNTSNITSKITSRTKNNNTKQLTRGRSNSVNISTPTKNPYDTFF